MSEHVRVSRTEHGVEILLDRPDKKNALTGAMYTALADTIEQAEDDAEIRTVLLAGAGANFTAGNDLQDFLTNPPGDDSPVGRFLAAIASTSVPVVAAVHGPAVGVGATMLLHCDHVVAAEDAVLQFPFVGMALVPEAGSTLLLPRAVGRLRAAEILLTGEPLDAAQALELGLVSRVVPAGEHLDAARAFAARVAAQPAEAVRLTKRLLADDSPGVQPRIAREGTLFLQRLQSPEFVAAVQAFLASRASAREQS